MPGRGARFQGLFTAPADQYQYLSFMIQAAEDGWLVEILSTPEETPRMPVFLTYVLLGKLGAVLAGLSMGNAVPALALKKVVAGHNALTIEFERKRHDLETFFRPAATAAERKAILQRYQVGYVYYGPDERRRTGQPVLEHPQLEQAFGNGTVTIYRVKG